MNSDDERTKLAHTTNELADKLLGCHAAGMSLTMLPRQLLNLAAVLKGWAAECGRLAEQRDTPRASDVMSEIRVLRLHAAILAVLPYIETPHVRATLQNAVAETGGKT